MGKYDRSTSRGKNDKYGPYNKSKSLAKFARRLEEAENWFKTDAGQAFKARQARSESTLKESNYSAYSPPTSPLAIEDKDHSIRIASEAELLKWKTNHPNEYDKRQTARRIKMHKKLTRQGCADKKAWALSFKKFPKRSEEIGQEEYTLWTVSESDIQHNSDYDSEHHS